MLPIPIPQMYFEILKTIILKFVWQNKKQRIKFSVVSKNKLQGGLAVPDVKAYYNSVFISRVLDLTKDTKKKKKKRWVQIEKTMSGALLSKIVWIPAQYRGTETHALTLGDIKNMGFNT